MIDECISMDDKNDRENLNDSIQRYKVLVAKLNPQSQARSTIGELDLELKKVKKKRWEFHFDLTQPIPNRICMFNLLSSSSFIFLKKKR